MSDRILTEDLKKARRSLDGLLNFHRLSEIEWNRAICKWIFRFNILSAGSEYVPKNSEWYAIIDEDYPWGEIKVSPAVENSIGHTFPHMSLLEKETSNLWNSATLCLGSSISAFKRREIYEESFTAGKRLRWYIERTIQWVELASRNQLLSEGDPFELPVFPKASLHSRFYISSESAEDLQTWLEYTGETGVFHAIPLKGNTFSQLSDPRIILRFFLKTGKNVKTYSWGSLFSRLEKNSRKNRKYETGLWLLLPVVPIVEAWEVPRTWTELDEICKLHDINLFELIQKSMFNLPPSNSNTLLVGFPIPENFGESSKLIHWQAIAMPQLLDMKSNINGFRRGSDSSIQYLLKKNLRLFSTSGIDYLDSQNWNALEISNRGRFTVDFHRKNTLIIGAGAFGALFAEQLARNGMQNITLADGDKLAVGNLVRHNLNLSDLGLSKSKSVSELLNRVGPHIQSKALFENFPPNNELGKSIVGNSEIVIDCTASDELLLDLKNFLWNEKTRYFFSFSFGLNGKRMFAFFHKGLIFPESTFRNNIKPWLEYELENLGYNHPREGTGCWHNVFPARIDDVQIMVSAAVKYFEERLVKDEEGSHFVVFEQVAEEEFLGVRRASFPPGVSQKI